MAVNDVVFGMEVFVHLLGTLPADNYTFVDITGVGDITKSRAEKDVTRLNDVSKRFRMSASSEIADLSLDLYATTDGYTKLNTLFKNNTVGKFAVEFPTGLTDASMQFDAYIKEIKLGGIKNEDIVTLSVTLKIDGTTLAPYVEA